MAHAGPSVAGAYSYFVLSIVIITNYNYIITNTIEIEIHRSCSCQKGGVA